MKAQTLGTPRIAVRYARAELEGVAVSKDRVAIITGASTGIGRGIAVSLARKGIRIAGLDIDTQGNQETIALARRAGAAGVAIDCDVTDKGQVRRAVNDVVAAFGRIDILVNNAAVYLDTSLTAGTFESQTRAWDQSLLVCASGTYYCTRAALPFLRQHAAGNVINIITEHIKEGHLMTGMPASGYDCAKWAQWRLTETWAVELAPLGVRVNALCMGATDTPMLRAVSVPIAEAGMKPEDVGQAVLNLLAHGADGPTGQSFLFGTTGTPRAASLEQIAALGPRP
jgi:NAD(P)-dependent dehydrogenase (short-subunit alcohol dehydrogenase family)